MMHTYKMTVPQKADGTTIRGLDLTLTSSAYYLVETDLDLEAALLALLRHGIQVATLTAAELAELPIAQAGTLRLTNQDLSVAGETEGEADNAEK